MKYSHHIARNVLCNCITDPSSTRKIKKGVRWLVMDEGEHLFGLFVYFFFWLALTKNMNRPLKIG